MAHLLVDVDPRLEHVRDHGPGNCVERAVDDGLAALLLGQPGRHGRRRAQVLTLLERIKSLVFRLVTPLKFLVKNTLISQFTRLWDVYRSVASFDCDNCRRATVVQRLLYTINIVSCRTCSRISLMSSLLLSLPSYMTFCTARPRNKRCTQTIERAP